MNVLEKGFRRVSDVVGRRSSRSPAPPTGAKAAINAPTATGAADKANGDLYERLSSELYEIRVLTILENPIRNPFSDEIMCTMEHVELLNPGEYTALSYCWGDTRRKVPIIINGITVHVTLNLGAALQQLRTRGYRRVWIDALCINQNDREERSLQIRNMRLIYSKAREVVSWVGSAKDEDALVIKILMENDWRTSIEHNLYPKLMDEGPRLEVFFRQSYWKRVWIIQEVAVASNVIMLYGNVEISWEALARTIDNWRMYPKALPAEIRFCSYASQLLDFRFKVSVAQQPISLLEAIRWSNSSLATDPRDKIFALLGVSFDGPALVPLPNYKQPLQEILKDLTVALIAADRSLDLISVKEMFPIIDPTMPSWVPNLLELWSVPMPFMSREILRERRNYMIKPPVERVGNSLLRVKGRLLGRINSLSTAATIPPLSGEVLDASVAPRSRLYGSETGIPDAIWKSLTMGAFSRKHTDDVVGDFEPFRACFAFLWTTEGKMQLRNTPVLAKWLDDNAAFPVGTCTLEQLSQTLNETSPWKSVFGQIFGQSEEAFAPGNLKHFIESMRNVLEGSMRLMMTRDGYIGMAHPAARIGDEVCCITGCSVPLILRESINRPDNETAHRVVGASYVHGVLDSRQAPDWVQLCGNGIRAPKEEAEMFTGYRIFLLC